MRQKITVMGHEYAIKTELPETWISMLEEKLDERINEITISSPNLSAVDTLALLAINLMDDLAKAEDTASNLREQLTVYFRESKYVKSQAAELCKEDETDLFENDENDEEF